MWQWCLEVAATSLNKEISDEESLLYVGFNGQE